MSSLAIAFCAPVFSYRLALFPTTYYGWFMKSDPLPKLMRFSIKRFGLNHNVARLAYGDMIFLWNRTEPVMMGL